jgi:hypothetical protein
VVTHSCGLIGECLADDSEAIAFIEPQRSIACSCPYVVMVLVGRTFDAGTQEKFAEAATLQV